MVYPADGNFDTSTHILGRTGDVVRKFLKDKAFCTFLNIDPDDLGFPRKGSVQTGALRTLIGEVKKIDTYFGITGITSGTLQPQPQLELKTSTVPYFFDKFLRSYVVEGKEGKGESGNIVRKLQEKMLPNVISKMGGLAMFSLTQLLLLQKNMDEVTKEIDTFLKEQGVENRLEDKKDIDNVEQQQRRIQQKKFVQQKLLEMREQLKDAKKRIEFAMQYAQYMESKYPAYAGLSPLYALLYAGNITQQEWSQLRAYIADNVMSKTEKEEFSSLLPENLGEWLKLLEESANKTNKKVAPPTQQQPQQQQEQPQQPQEKQKEELDNIGKNIKELYVNEKPLQQNKQNLSDVDELELKTELRLPPIIVDHKNVISFLPDYLKNIELSSIANENTKNQLSALFNDAVNAITIHPLLNLLQNVSPDLSLPPLFRPYCVNRSHLVGGYLSPDDIYQAVEKYVDEYGKKFSCLDNVVRQLTNISDQELQQLGSNLSVKQIKEISARAENMRGFSVFSDAELAQIIVTVDQFKQRLEKLLQGNSSDENAKKSVQEAVGKLDDIRKVAIYTHEYLLQAQKQAQKTSNKYREGLPAIYYLLTELNLSQESWKKIKEHKDILTDETEKKLLGESGGLGNLQQWLSDLQLIANKHSTTEYSKKLQLTQVENTKDFINKYIVEPSLNPAPEFTSALNPILTYSPSTPSLIPLPQQSQSITPISTSFIKPTPQTTSIPSSSPKTPTPKTPTKPTSSPTKLSDSEQKTGTGKILSDSAATQMEIDNIAKLLVSGERKNVNAANEKMDKLFRIFSLNREFAEMLVHALVQATVKTHFNDKQSEVLGKKEARLKIINVFFDYTLNKKSSVLALLKNESKIKNLRVKPNFNLGEFCKKLNEGKGEKDSSDLADALENISVASLKQKIFYLETRNEKYVQNVKEVQIHIENVRKKQQEIREHTKIIEGLMEKLKGQAQQIEKGKKTTKEIISEYKQTLGNTVQNFDEVFNKVMKSTDVINNKTEEVKNVVNSIEEKNKKTGGISSEIQKEVKKLLDGCEQELKKRGDLLKKYEDLVQDYEKQAKLYKEEVERQQKTIEEQKKREEEYKKHHEEFNKLLDKHKNFETEVNHYLENSTNSFSQDVGEITKEINNKAEQLEQVLQKIDELKKELFGVGKNFNVTKPDEVKKGMQNTQEVMKQILEQEKKHKELEEELKNDEDEMNKMLNSINELTKKLDDKQKLLQEGKSLLEEYKKMVNEVNEKRDELNKEAEKLKNTAGKTDFIPQSLTVSPAENTLQIKLENSIEEISKKIELQKTEIYNKKIEINTGLSDVSQKKKKFQEQQMQQMSDLVEKYNSLQLETMKLVEKNVNTLASDVESLGVKIQNKKKSVEQLKSDIEILKNDKTKSLVNKEKLLKPYGEQSTTLENEIKNLKQEKEEKVEQLSKFIQDKEKILQEQKELEQKHKQLISEKLLFEKKTEEEIKKIKETPEISFENTFNEAKNKIDKLFTELDTNVKGISEDVNSAKNALNVITKEVSEIKNLQGEVEKIKQDVKEKMQKLEEQEKKEFEGFNIVLEEILKEINAVNGELQKVNGCTVAAEKGLDVCGEGLNNIQINIEMDEKQRLELARLAALQEVINKTGERIKILEKAENGGKKNATEIASLTKKKDKLVSLMQQVKNLYVNKGQLKKEALDKQLQLKWKEIDKEINRRRSWLSAFSLLAPWYKTTTKIEFDKQLKAWKEKKQFTLGELGLQQEFITQVTLTLGERIKQKEKEDEEIKKEIELEMEKSEKINVIATIDNVEDVIESMLKNKEVTVDENKSKEIAEKIQKARDLDKKFKDISNKLAELKKVRKEKKVQSTQLEVNKIEKKEDIDKKENVDEEKKKLEVTQKTEKEKKLGQELDTCIDDLKKAREDLFTELNNLNEQLLEKQPKEQVSEKPRTEHENGEEESEEQEIFKVFSVDNVKKRIEEISREIKVAQEEIDKIKKKKDETKEETKEIKQEKNSELLQLERKILRLEQEKQELEELQKKDEVFQIWRQVLNPQPSQEQKNNEEVTNLKSEIQIAKDRFEHEYRRLKKKTQKIKHSLEPIQLYIKNVNRHAERKFIQNLKTAYPSEFSQMLSGFKAWGKYAGEIALLGADPAIKTFTAILKDITATSILVLQGAVTFSTFMSVFQVGAVAAVSTFATSILGGLKIAVPPILAVQCASYAKTFATEGVLSAMALFLKTNPYTGGVAVNTAQQETALMRHFSFCYGIVSGTYLEEIFSGVLTLQKTYKDLSNSMKKAIKDKTEQFNKIPDENVTEKKKAGEKLQEAFKEKEAFQSAKKIEYFASMTMYSKTLAIIARFLEKGDGNLMDGLQAGIKVLKDRKGDLENKYYGKAGRKSTMRLLRKSVPNLIKNLFTGISGSVGENGLLGAIADSFDSDATSELVKFFQKKIGGIIEKTQKELTQEEKQEFKSKYSDYIEEETQKAEENIKKLFSSDNPLSNVKEEGMKEFKDAVKEDVKKDVPKEVEEKKKEELIKKENIEKENKRGLYLTEIIGTFDQYKETEQYKKEMTLNGNQLPALIRVKSDNKSSQQKTSEKQVNKNKGGIKDIKGAGGDEKNTEKKDTLSLGSGDKYYFCYWSAFTGNMCVAPISSILTPDLNKWWKDRKGPTCETNKSGSSDDVSGSNENFKVPCSETKYIEESRISGCIKNVINSTREQQSTKKIQAILKKLDKPETKVEGVLLKIEKETLKQEKIQQDKLKKRSHEKSITTKTIDFVKNVVETFVESTVDGGDNANKMKPK